MEVRIISREMVKPSSPELVLNQKPFKLSFLDQLTPTVYIPLIFFYTPQPKNTCQVNNAQLVDQLKQSFSKALNLFYPLSGRVTSNLSIDSYEEGLPYAEARVNGCLSDYLGQQETLTMNELLPCQPYCNLQNSIVPLLAIQVNIFECGGIALALCFCHKIIDASTVSSFLKTWAAFNRGGCEGEIPNPDSDLLQAGSRLFPPMEPMPESFVSFSESLWFPPGRRKTRNFVFNADAIATLKLEAKSKEFEHNPTRFTALTAFVWKHAMLASRSASRIPKPALLGQPMNLRSRAKPPLPDHSIGNLIWFPITAYEGADDKDIELHELAYLTKEAVRSFESDHLDLLQTDLGQFIAATEPIIQQVHELVSEGNAEYYGFTSWLYTLDGKGIDFGRGEPSLLSIPKFDSRNQSGGYYNATIFKEVIGQPGAIEAWITLEEKVMDVLEHDPNFLQFASPTPY